MASAYSQDLRDRVIDAVIRGGMSRRAAAARFGVSESSAIKWVQRFERSGSRAASRMGGYLRPKLEPHRPTTVAANRGHVVLFCGGGNYARTRGLPGGAEGIRTDSH